MARNKKIRSGSTVGKQACVLDGVFFLKLVLYLVMGSLWVKVSRGESMQIALPIGLIVGVLFAAHEHFQIDRKIEYAVLVVAMLIGFLSPYGLYVAF